MTASRSCAYRFHSPIGTPSRTARPWCSRMPPPSVVRFKLFTLDHRLIRSTLGQLAEADRAAVLGALQRLLRVVP